MPEKPKRVESEYKRVRRSQAEWLGSKSVQAVLPEGERPVQGNGRKRMNIRGKGPHREEDPANRKVGGAVFATRAVVDYHGGTRIAELSCGHRKRYRMPWAPYFMSCGECVEAEITVIVEQMLKRPRARWRREGKVLPETVPEVKLFGGGKKP